ncbi:hypothetical protein AV274_5476 [Blastocystis sp. ATCC 50177/Nand II]|uniref:Uncharacterized protein n=1 Tax=Blastocystis sp. subtype 1 (strain ATCC 50177 / NandII) TaxID=478820 RepID=A0A196S8Z2_BLAHN|nr:hypothetical protein AV274_5476 [Blastocystis sp. ATCC 50177/Nand II]
MAWLVDNCGFTISHSKALEIPCLNCLGIEKDGVRFLDDRAVEFTSKTRSTVVKTVIHFALFGDIGLKVYDCLKLLVNNYEADSFFYYRLTHIPDINPVIFQLSFRRRCGIEKFNCLLDRPSDPLDLTNPEDLFYFVCDTLSYAYQYVSSFTASLNLDAPAIYQQAAKTYDSTQSRLQHFVAYVYYKKQYLNAKRGIPLDLKKRVSGKIRNPPNKVLLSNPHSKEELKYLYKRAKHCYCAEKKNVSNQFERALRIVVSNDRVKPLLRWVQTDYLEKWLLAKGQDVGYLLLSI